jgi:hypothetical protein
MLHSNFDLSLSLCLSFFNCLALKTFCSLHRVALPRARLIIQRTKNLGLLAYLILIKYPTKKFFRLYQT